MPFPRKLLVQSEQLILDLRPHPIALVMPVFLTVVGFVAATWLSARTDFADWIWWALFAIGFVVFPLREIVAWLTSNFVVTSERVVHRAGFIAKRSMEIPLEEIADVRFEQGIIDRIVGAGSLIISSASEFGRNDFDDIRHPDEVQKTIYEQGELNKRRMYQGDASGARAQPNGGHPAAGPPPPAPPMPPSAPSATTELERLGRLRADGVLTEEEFQAQKARILRGDPA